MTITNDQIKLIEDEFNEWQDKQYAGKDKKARQALGAFFTPPSLTVKMLEKFDSIQNKDILDPAMGAGGLLVAAILAGADPARIFGIELDETIYDVAVKRLGKYGVPKQNLNLGDALNDSSYIFEN